MLRLAADALALAGIRAATLAGGGGGGRGSGSALGGSGAVAAFVENAETRVLLVPLRTSGGAAGLTLTVAQTAVLLDAAVHASLEQQAVGRLHRIGQRQPVSVVRLRAAGTVEGRLGAGGARGLPRTTAAMRALLEAAALD